MPAPAPSRPDPLALTSGAFVAAARAAGGRPDVALDAYRQAYREGRTDLPDAPVALPPIAREQSEEGPEGVTTKFVSRLDAGDTPVSANTPHLDIESVVIPMVGKSGRRTHTLCVSSQVGCAMGCGFCETAQMGLIRSLSTSEIVAQWFAARHALRGARGIEVSNIVFMGMGEPL
ncbi:MAG: hypothetical protein KDA05_08815, partial [Phycisphaerales bacterium]|nr:hypothetical protein [Phycisphaerales bacterium]